MFQNLTKVFVSLIFFSPFVGWAQSFQTVEEINDECSVLGFSSNEEAQLMVDRITESVGLFRNFVVQECPNINNAIAKNIEVEPGYKERYILYDNDFFERINNSANTDWAAISILAHEIGHHLNGHALTNKGSTHEFEIEADYFSGMALAKMGATLDEAKGAIQSLKYERATATHPAKFDRLMAIQEGWNKGKGITNTKTQEEINQEKALDLFKNGQALFKEHSFLNAYKSFEQAADLGYADAYFYMGMMKYMGMGIKYDKRGAYNYAKKGQKMGSVPCGYLMGKCLRNGSGTRINLETGMRLLNKDYSMQWFKDNFRKTNSPIYAALIGEMYMQGFGVDKDAETAMFWYKNSASNGDLIAMNLLGFEYNIGSNINQDFNKATEWYRKAAEKGLPTAQYNLAIRYKDGKGVPQKDYEKCIYWAKKAAAKDHFYAMNLLGELYANGTGVPKNESTALDWYKQAAALNYASAKTNIGTIYYNRGQIDEAKNWYRKAAHQGNPTAQYNLGVILNDREEYGEAYSWFKKAAGQNDLNAQFSLGVAYAEGRGVKMDYDKAIYWLKKAARQGHQSAQKTLQSNNETW